MTPPNLTRGDDGREGAGASAVERWLPIPSREGQHEASDLGRVRSLITGQVLRPYLDRDGYLRVSLRRPGKAASGFLVHRLVCRAFHGEPPPGRPEGAHLDGNRTNARADNLQWVSKVENMFHKRAHGTHPAGEKHPQAKLSEDDARAILAAPNGASMADLGRRYGVTGQHIRHIRQGRAWKCLALAAVEAGA